MNLVDDDGIWRTIAVPSRLYSKYSPNRPLAGARLCLKDIFRLKGVKTTMMSRAFTALHEPEHESADYVTKLLDLGAVIVGKTKMTQFASSDEPTDQWIDFHCPFNPRGDMYQSLPAAHRVLPQRLPDTSGWITPLQGIVCYPSH